MGRTGYKAFGISMSIFSFLFAMILVGSSLAEEETPTEQYHVKQTQYHSTSAVFVDEKTRYLPAPECFDPPRGQCRFYADCLEKRYHCGSTGYPLGYGQRYCEKFSQARSTLSPEGQTWMLDTMECLQRALISAATSEVPLDTCKALEDVAFDSHAKCYIDSGLCMLGIKDWISIVKIINIKTLVSSWDAVKETIDAAKGCLGLYISSL